MRRSQRRLELRDAAQESRLICVAQKGLVLARFTELTAKRTKVVTKVVAGMVVLLAAGEAFAGLPSSGKGRRSQELRGL